MSYRTYLKSLSILSILISSMVISISAHSEQDIISKHQYKLYKGTILFGKSTYSLYKHDNIYFFEIKSQTDGVFKLKKDYRLERSEFKKNDHLISPIQYEYIRQKKDKDDYIITKFDNDLIATTLVNKEKKEHMNINGALDRLSLQIAFQESMKKGVFEKTYNVIDKGRLREYTFTIHSDDVIETLFGKTNTIVIKRKIKNNKRSTLTWYAIDHNYIPVKIEQYRKKSLKFTAILENIIK